MRPEAEASGYPLCGEWRTEAGAGSRFAKDDEPKFAKDDDPKTVVVRVLQSELSAGKIANAMATWGYSVAPWYQGRGSTR